MRAFAPVSATLLSFAVAAGCASPMTPNGSGSAGGTGNTTGVAGTGGSAVAMCGPQTPPAPSGGANYPFPQHRLAQNNCAYPTNCNDADVRTAWETYKTRHIVSASPGLRVQ